MNKQYVCVFTLEGEVVTRNDFELRGGMLPQPGGQRGSEDQR